MRRQVERAGSLGLSVLAQAEYELYLLDAETRAAAVRRHGHHDHVTNQRLPVLPQLVRDLRGFGLSPRTLNQEWGPTQYELTFDPVEGLAAGDDNFTYKTYAKEIAAQHGLIASVHEQAVHRDLGIEQPSPPEPLPRRDVTSSGTRTATASRSEFLWAIGGLLAHAPGLNALLGPTVNCVKRYRKGTYAPASITWGYENRSVAIRVKALRGEHTHVENRLGCGACNPYLAFAGMIAAILDGIERRLDPPPPLEESAYQLDDLALLPSTLDEALESFEEDGILADAFHPEFVKAFLALKRHEIEKARERGSQLRDQRSGTTT